MNNTIPPEVSDPILNFLKTQKWIILILVISIILAYFSVMLLGKNNIVELEVEKVIEIETGVEVNLTP